MFVGFFLRYGMMVEIDMKTKEEKISKLGFFFWDGFGWIDV